MTLEKLPAVDVAPQLVSPVAVVANSAAVVVVPVVVVAAAACEVGMKSVTITGLLAVPPTQLVLLLLLLLLRSPRGLRTGSGAASNFLLAGC